MQQLTVTLDDALWDALHQAAAEQNTTAEDFIREALREKLGVPRPKPRTLGVADSGYSDTSLRVGEERPVPRPFR